MEGKMMTIEEAEIILDDFFNKNPSFRNKTSGETVRYIESLPEAERIPIESALRRFAQFGGWGATNN